jgi:ureidoglycolate hydrolase
MFGWENTMMVDEKLIETREFRGVGYQPLIDFKSWRVAILNFIDEIIPDQIKTFERHTETDEVFILLHGKAILFVGDGNHKLENIYSVVMQPENIYNIKCNIWHSVVLSRDGSVLIVENQDTNKNNTQYSSLLPTHQQYVCKVAREEQPEDWGKLHTV